jgi:hypothetical protein
MKEKQYSKPRSRIFRKTIQYNHDPKEATTWQRLTMVNKEKFEKRMVIVFYFFAWIVIPIIQVFKLLDIIP